MKRVSLGTTISKILSNIRLDTYVLLLLLMIGFAYIKPEWGVAKGNFALSTLITYGVSLIFFFYGLRLSVSRLYAELFNWKLHLLVQSGTFILFPVLAMVIHLSLNLDFTEPLWLGVFFLSALPSTVSSSVVMVSIAGGNLPAAIFNASISSILGVFITPLWLALADASTPTDDTFFSGIIGKLIIQILVPVILGVFLHQWFGAFAEKYKKQIKYFDQTVILLIIYTSFSASFANNIFGGVHYGTLLVLFLGMLGLFILVYSLISAVGSVLHLSREDRITVVFCGSKKSLVHGTVMAAVLFSNNASIGLILMPLILYHALQLIITSVIARGMSKQILPG